MLTSGFGCKQTITAENLKPFTLNIWGVWEDKEAIEQIAANYMLIHPNATINFKKFRYNEYEKELVNALAEDRGPDIFAIHNTWLRKYQNKLEPMPDTITMVYPVTKGSIKKETVPEKITTKSLTINDIKQKFVDVVSEDVIIDVKDEKTQRTEKKVFGLPLAMDTLAMFYNKDLFNNAGIAEPPAFWNKEFQQDVKKLTRQDVKGQLVQSGVSLGSSANIERYFDLLSVIMMQNGTQMADDSGNIAFNSIPLALRDQGYHPGVEALRFYTDFSNPAKEVYCWNDELENSLELFSQGKVAITFGYSYHLPQIRAQAPKLNLGIAKLPQIEGNSAAINFANYWIMAASIKSKNKNPNNEAWDFIQFMTKEDQAKIYLNIPADGAQPTADRLAKPTALRSLRNGQLDDVNIGIFSDQILTAKSWYKGMDPDSAEKIMGEMIDLAQGGKEELEPIVQNAASKMQQTLEKHQPEN